MANNALPTASELFWEGVEAAQGGNRLMARTRLERCAELDPSNADCWIWLAWTADSPKSALFALRQATKCDPQNTAANSGLTWVNTLCEFTPAVGSASRESPPLSDQHPAPADSFETVDEPSDGTDAQPTSGLTFDRWDTEDNAGVTDAAARGESAPSGLPTEPDWHEFPWEPLRGSDSTEPSASAIDLHADIEDWCDSPELLEPPQSADGDWNQEIAHDPVPMANEPLALFGPEGEGASDAEDQEPTLDVYVADSNLSCPNQEDAWGNAATVPCEAEIPCAADRGSESDEPVEASTVQPSHAEDLDEIGPDEIGPNAPDLAATSEVAHDDDVLAGIEAVRHELEDLQAEVTSSLVPLPEPAATPTIPAPVVFEPIGGESTEMPEAGAGEPAADPRITILAVDDSPTIQKLVKITLEKYGYKVVTASDGMQAVRSLTTLTPALVLTDINMPRLDGYQLCKLIKKHQNTRHVPVIMLSGKDGVFDKLRGRMVGCNDYVTKPFESGQLIQKVAAHVPLPQNV